MFLENAFPKRVGRRVSLLGPCLVVLLLLSSAITTRTQDAASSGNGVVIVSVIGRDGEPVDRMFDVTLTRIGFDYNNIEQKTGPNGVTQFNGLAYSRYRVMASDPNYNDSGDELELTAARGVVTVTLTVDRKGTDSSETPAKGFALAPKAKKEVDAGMKAMHAGQYNDALQHLQAAYKLAPGNPDVNDILGEIYLTTKDFANAQKYIQNAISIEPDNLSALMDMGYLQVEQKDYVLAEISLERAVNLAPQAWRPYWLLGEAYLRLNQVDKARDEATAAIKTGKGQAFDAEYLLGESLAVLGEHGEAIKALQQLVTDAPDNSNVPAAKTLIARLQAADAVSSLSAPRSSTTADAPANSTAAAQPN